MDVDGEHNSTLFEAKNSIIRGEAFLHTRSRDRPERTLSSHVRDRYVGFEEATATAFLKQDEAHGRITVSCDTHSRT